MIGVNVKTTDETPKVEAEVRKANYRNLGHAAASIRKFAAGLIKRGKRASDKGTPPRTRRGLLRRALRWAVEHRGQGDETAVVGPRASMVGTAAAAHEHGGTYKGEDYPQRPFMGPALEANLDRFADEWAKGLG